MGIPVIFRIAYARLVLSSLFGLLLAALSSLSPGPAHGAQPELVIQNVITIPPTAVTGSPVLIILRTYADDPRSDAATLPVQLEFDIEQAGKVLARARPRQVEVANRMIGEIRHQFDAGPPGHYQARFRLTGNRMHADALAYLAVAANQAEADAISQRLMSLCTGLEGGSVSIVDLLTGEAECKCAPGMQPDASRTRCEPWP